MKLGMFLRDVNALRHHHEVKPTVIIGPADAQGDCLIVAVTKEPMGPAGQAGQVCERTAEEHQACNPCITQRVPG